MTSPGTILNGYSVKAVLYKPPSLHFIRLLGENIAGQGYQVSHNSALMIALVHMLTCIMSLRHIYSETMPWLALFIRLKLGAATVIDTVIRCGLADMPRIPKEITLTPPSHHHMYIFHFIKGTALFLLYHNITLRTLKQLRVT